MNQTDSRDDSVVDGSNQPDYRAIDIPSKERSQYDWRERRAELLQLIEEAGTPGAINQTQLADRYGVSQQQISKDLDRLGAHAHERIVDRDRRAFTVGSVVERSIRGLMDEEEWRKAAKTAMEYDEWLTGFHDLDKMQERMDELEAERDGRRR